MGPAGSAHSREVVASSVVSPGAAWRASGRAKTPVEVEGPPERPVEALTPVPPEPPPALQGRKG